jgi:hypothetical protein
MSMDDSPMTSSRRGRIICSLIAVSAFFAVGNIYYFVPSGKSYVEKYVEKSSPTAKNSTVFFDRSNRPNSLTLEDVNCSFTERESSTFRCPQKAGIRVSPAGSQSMIQMYQGTDRDLFLRCANLPIPMDNESPKECWPRLIVLASWPTSGNVLMRSLLQATTSPMAIALGGSERLFFKDVVPPSKENGFTSLDIYGSFIRDTALPLMKRALIFKSHKGTKVDEPARQHDANLMQEARRMDRLDGIIRLARNPGDQILRNTFRWFNSRCYKRGDVCFFERAHLVCKDMMKRAYDYNSFHEFWNTLDSDISQIIVHYEHVSNKSYAEDTVEEVLKYVDDLTPEMDYKHFLPMRRVEDMLTGIREPKFRQGAVLQRVCGKDLSRQIHNITKDISARLGYRFDNESATWSLDPEKPHPILIAK